MKKLFVICFLITIVTPSICFSQNPMSKEEQVAAMYNTNKELIKSQKYSFVASWVIRGKNRTEVDQNANTIKINESLISGTLTTINTNKTTLDLKGSLQNYNVIFNDAAQQITITFSVGGYNAQIDIKPNGNSFLELTNNNEEKLTYRGGIKRTL